MRSPPLTPQPTASGLLQGAPLPVIPPAYEMMLRYEMIQKREINRKSSYHNS